MDIPRLFNITESAHRIHNPITPEKLATLGAVMERALEGDTRDLPGLDAAWIKQLAAEGITSGCGSGNYCPAGPVTRAQMAVFLLRSKYGTSYSPPAVGATTGFTDVPTNYWAAAWIKQLVAEGITAGCGNGNYCPEVPVTRAQMAVFLLRGIHGSSYSPPAVGASTGFGDVPVEYWADKWIKQLAAEGITGGQGNPAQYLIMMKYIESLRDMSRSNNSKVVFMPVETSNVLSSIGAFKEVFGDLNSPESVPVQRLTRKNE